MNGSGKSYCLYLSFILNEVLKHPKGIHCICALSNQQLKAVSIPYVRYFLDEFKVAHTYNKTDNIILLKNKDKTQIMLRSAETHERMRSVEISSLYIEEASFMQYDAFTTFLGRVRNQHGSRNIRTCFTPNGRSHWTFEFFIEKQSEDRRIIFASTFDNKHLPAEYVKMLQDSYDSHMQAQEIMGQFLDSSGGSVYYMFDRQRHVIETSQDKLPITWIGMDFNCNPMTAVCCNITGDTITVVEEIYLENSNTYEMRDELLDRFSNSKIKIVADSTADSRRTSATKTDHQILREGGLDVARFRNPRVGDRYNTVNNLLEKGKLKVNSSCKMVIRDLEKFSRDNKDPMLSHISDSLGYLAWYLFPLKRTNDINKPDTTRIL